MTRLTAFIAFSLLCASTLAADYPLEIIELKGRTVDEIIPLIEPFVGPDGSVSGMNNQLIIRAAPERMQEVRKILERFDHPPRNLLIHVRQGRITEQERSRLEAGVNVDIGEHVQIEAGKKTPRDSIRLNAGARHTLDSDDVTHRLRATEGSAAFIATGQSVPIREQNTYIAGGVVHKETSTRYRDVTGGFYVTPQLNGDQVTLRISPHLDRPGRESGSFDIQRTTTTVVGRLGEWIPVGGVEHGSSRDSSGPLHRHATQSQEDSQIYLLVEEVP